MSFDIALSGIQAINESLNITSHNIANAGTYGYKASRANFSALIAGSHPTGVQVGSTTQNLSLAGGILSTGRSLDAAINGSGYFVTKDATTGQIEYTRVGIFSASKTGYLVDASGRKVQGNIITPGTTTKGPVGDLAIPTGQIPAVASQNINYVGNLSADWTNPTTDWAAPDPVDAAHPPETTSFSMSKATVIYDTLGGQHTLTQYFSRTKDTPGSVDVNYTLDGADLNMKTTLVFDTTTGQMTTPDPAADNGKLTLGLAGASLTTSNGGSLKDITIDYTGTTGFAGEATTATNNADGYASGTFSGVDLASDGSVVAKYSNGQKQAIGVLAIATFADEGSLTAVDDTSWIESVASGQPNIDNPGIGMGGTLTTSSLEQSNVDITSELVGLMTSQRNYQANSKVIQTESTMLQSLMQAI